MTPGKHRQTPFIRPCTLLKTNSSPLKYSNHPFSGVNLLLVSAIGYSKRAPISLHLYITNGRRAHLVVETPFWKDISERIPRSRTIKIRVPNFWMMNKFPTPNTPQWDWSIYLHEWFIFMVFMLANKTIHSVSGYLIKMFDLVKFHISYLFNGFCWDFQGKGESSGDFF